MGGLSRPICARLARTLSPGLDRLLDNLPVGSPPPASADLQRAIGLFNRMAGYLDKTRPVWPDPAGLGASANVAIPRDGPSRADSGGREKRADDVRLGIYR